MYKDFFEIMHRFNTYRTSEPIREVTRVQMLQMRRECPAWMLRHVNRFIAANFSQPEAITR